MTTTSPNTTPNVTGASSPTSDYASLMTEIKATIDKNDLLFKQIQQSNYPNAGSYSSDLINYKIDTQVTDLTKARQQIWDFLNKKYNENTKLRSYYFDEIRKIDEHIADLSEQQQKIIDSIESKNIKTNTSTESIKNEKFIYNKMQYYLFLYKVLILVQIAILAIITLCIVGVIPNSTCLILTVILLLLATAFVGYYVFFVNIGRSMFSWTKFEHNNGIPITGGQCPGSAVVSSKDQQRASADAAVADIIAKNKSKNA